jgi:hypothetical protein
VQNNNSNKRLIFEKHRRLILCFIGALVAFIVLHRVWFYVMGAFGVIGAVWVVREYNKNVDQK